MPEAEEAGFVRAAQRGDRVAYLALARWHWPAVSGIVRALTKPERVAERTLDVFEHGWKGLDYLPQGQSYFAWILRIAFNLCRSAPELEAFGFGAGPEPPTDSADVPAQIDAGLLRLAAQQRDPLILALACNLDHADIGRVLDIVPRIVAERISEARAEIYSGRGGWLPAAGLRHFRLTQLCDYVGTDPAGAPEFVRDHLAECTDCRAVLTALESQDRILARRLAGREDGEGIERFLHDIVERLGGEVARTEREEASDAETEWDEPRVPVAAPRTSAPRVREARKPAPRSMRPDHPGPTLAAVVMVVVVLLAIVLGPRAQPWLTRMGIHWGPPSNRNPATEVAGSDRPEHSWVPSETTGLEPERVGDSAGEGRRVPLGISPAPPAPAAAPEQTSARKATPASGAVTSSSTRTVQSPPRRNRTASESKARPAATPSLLCGQVVDHDGRPVAGAQVVFTGVEVALLTDRTGRFCLSAPGGEQVLLVAHPGFVPARRRVSVGPRSAELTVVLDPVVTQ